MHFEATMDNRWICAFAFSTPKFCKAKLHISPERCPKARAKAEKQTLRKRRWIDGKKEI